MAFGLKMMRILAFAVLCFHQQPAFCPSLGPPINAACQGTNSTLTIGCTLYENVSLDLKFKEDKFPRTVCRCQKGQCECPGVDYSVTKNSHMKKEIEVYNLKHKPETLVCNPITVDGNLDDYLTAISANCTFTFPGLAMNATCQGTNSTLTIGCTLYENVTLDLKYKGDKFPHKRLVIFGIIAAIGIIVLIIYLKIPSITNKFISICRQNHNGNNIITGNQQTAITDKIPKISDTNQDDGNNINSPLLSKLDQHCHNIDEIRTPSLQLAEDEQQLYKSEELALRITCKDPILPATEQESVNCMDPGAESVIVPSGAFREGENEHTASHQELSAYPQNQPRIGIMQCDGAVTFRGELENTTPF